MAAGEAGDGSVSADWNAIWDVVEKERARPKAKMLTVEHEWELDPGDFDAGVPNRWICKNCRFWTDDHPAQHQFLPSKNEGESACILRQVRMVMES